MEEMKNDAFRSMANGSIVFYVLVWSEVDFGLQEQTVFSGTSAEVSD